MESEDDIVAKAVSRLWPYRAVLIEEREVVLAFLLPVPMWREVNASWWRGKSASLIGGDWNGNFFLRHCDGTVRYWSQAEGQDITVAKSVRDFVQLLQEPSHTGNPRWRDAT